MRSGEVVVRFAGDSYLFAINYRWFDYYLGSAKAASVPMYMYLLPRYLVVPR